MAKAWISDWVRSNKDVAEVMLVMFIQLPAEAENFAVAAECVCDIEVSIRPEDVTAQLPQLDTYRKTIRIQRFAQLPPTDGIDMNVIQLPTFSAAVKTDIPFRLHLEPG